MKSAILALVVAGAFMLGGSLVVNADDCFDHQRIKNLARALKAKRQSKEATDQAPERVVQGDQRDAKNHHHDHLDASGSVPSIPDWTTWKCEKPHVSHKIFETYKCYGPDESRISRVLMKVRGAKMPFLISWNYDEQATNSKGKAYAAIYKDGKWIMGARGIGFTTQEGRNSVTFYIFLDEGFSVLEQVEIKIPEANLVKVIM